MLWVLKRTVSMRQFVLAPQTYVQTDGLENIKNVMLKNCVGLNLVTCMVFICFIFCLLKFLIDPDIGDIDGK